MAKELNPYTAQTKEEKEQNQKREFKPLRPWFCPRCGKSMETADDYAYQISEMCEVCYIEVNRGVRLDHIQDKTYNAKVAEENDGQNNVKSNSDDV